MAVSVNWDDRGEIDKVIHAISRRPDVQEAQGPVEVVETHISIVLLTPKLVFKFKRPVNFGFANFRRLSRRRHFCHEEIRLNGRLAGGVYLGVTPLYRAGDQFTFDGGREVVDYAVVMRRLPAGNMLDALLASQGVSKPQLAALAELLAEFHQGGKLGKKPSQIGGLKTITQNWRENFAQVTPFANITIPPPQLSEIRLAVFSYLARNRDFLTRRVREGHIRDGHGDLRCEHIFFGKEVKIIDCVEFSDRFRYGDVASDLAFLLMDLTALGHPQAAAFLLEQYTRLSGDSRVVRLVPFYACYRAFVRGKVLSFRLSLGHAPPSEQYRIQAQARHFFTLASDFSRQMAPPAVVVMAGLMGTGKTSLSQGLSARMGMLHLSSDAIRKELAASMGETSEAATRKAPYQRGIYSAGWSRKTYRVIFQRLKTALEKGQSVVLDASFARRALREEAFQLARSLDAEPFLVECRAPEEKIRQRLARREKQTGPLSDGRRELFSRQSEAFEPVMEIPPECHLVVETVGEKSHQLDWVLSHPRLAVPPPLFSTRDGQSG